jgi:hypothetical protein
MSKYPFRAHRRAAALHRREHDFIAKLAGDLSAS